MLFIAISCHENAPVGAVQLAIHENTLTTDTSETDIVESGPPDLRAGYPSDSDIETIARALTEADRNMVFIHISYTVKKNSGLAYLK